MNSNYYYFIEYLPKRYQATNEQQKNRELVFSFKDGYISNDVKEMFLLKLKQIITLPQEWIICFIPASSSSRTQKRFLELAEYFTANTGWDVRLNAIHNLYDKEISHINGKSNNPTAGFGYEEDCFDKKKILLIDDVITRGTTFNSIGMELKKKGALSVTGLFLAKTINPDWNSTHYVDEDEWLTRQEEVMANMQYEEEPTYDDYNGSYAQDVEGWSDQEIDDVFDGNADAYWNID